MPEDSPPLFRQVPRRPCLPLDRIEVSPRMAHQSFALVVLLLALAGSESDPQIDPEHVTTLEALHGEEGVVPIFTYVEADSRGWPASAEHRQFVRFLQDNGIDVAFYSDEGSGWHFAFVAGSDSKRWKLLSEMAWEKGIPLPESPTPEDVAALEQLLFRGKPELPWWLNAVFLVGTLAVLFWVFAVRDRPASGWGSAT
jgi:hypothetical protein